LNALILVTLSLMSVLLAAPKVGDRAPEIHLEELLPEQPVANASFEEFAGKTVVLEMWATWCGPCVAAIPHLNELAEKFKDQPVVFLSVTDEEPEVVEYFLKKHPISGLIGIAHGHSPYSDYGLIGVPGTFLIDSHGRIAGSLDPTLLTANMIEAVMNYRELPAVDRSMLPPPVLPMTTIIRPHVDEPNSDIFKPPFENFHGPFFNQKLNSRTMSWVALKTIVQMIWDFKPTRIEGNGFDDHNAYDVFLSNPNATLETFVPWEQSVIESAFRIKVTRVTREVDAWVLTKLETKPEMLKPPGKIKDFSNNGKRGHIVVPNTSVSFIAQMLEGPADRPVVDETGITGLYDFELAWTGADEIRSIEAVRKAGFKIERARRPIEYLTVTKVEER
jgi:uncharacterized protein (TIGR03435 family)